MPRVRIIEDTPPGGAIDAEPDTEGHRIKLIRDVPKADSSVDGVEGHSVSSDD